MPIFDYKAVTKTGVVVKNRVQSPNKQTLMKSIKDNGLVIVDIEERSSRTKLGKTKQRKNMNSYHESVLNNTEVNSKSQMSRIDKINAYLAQTQKITNRDLVIFTQNFYLLKKSEFNNIHALRTLIESTENAYLKDIIKDILAGLEARRKYVYNNGILF